MKNKKNVIWGLILILVGVLAALKLFGLWDFTLLFDGWWTLFIIVPCVLGLFEGRNADILGSLTGIGIGVILLLACQDLFPMEDSWKLIVPFLIVMLGVKLIFGKKKEPVITTETKVDGRNIKVQFGAERVDLAGQSVENMKIDCSFGSVELDLRSAVFSDDAVLTVKCGFGEVKIFTSAGVAVENHINTGVGSVKIDAVSPENPMARLILVGDCGFGSVLVEN